jgi:hypothetical protein
VVVLLIKLLLAPALVVASSLAGRRWGAAVTGALVAFPIVAGPVLLVVHLEHGAAFTRESATAALLGLVSLAVFAPVFARLGRRWSWPAALLASWVAVLAVDAALAAVHLTGPAAFGVTLAGIAAAALAMPRSAVDRDTGTPPPPRWDLAARSIATAALVISLTTASAVLGPQWTGLLATFPTAASVVAAFALAQGGPVEASRMLAGLVRGLFGFAAFCCALSVLVEPVGVTAFACALVAALVVQAGVEFVRRTVRRPVPRHLGLSRG